MNADEARCVGCHEVIDPAWAFCSDCGADNRAPENREAIAFHSHTYPSHQHCIVCGQAVPDVDDMGRPVNRAWEAVKSILGLFFWRRRWWWDD